MATQIVLEDVDGLEVAVLKLVSLVEEGAHLGHSFVGSA